MNTNLLILFFLIVGNFKFIFSQEETKGLEITYIKELTQNRDSVNNYIQDEYLRLHSLMTDNLKSIRFQLLIQNNRSLFRESSILESNRKIFNVRSLAGSFGGTKGVFYVNTKDSIFINQKNFAGNKFRVKLKLKNWEITNEFKVINNYKCYKATTLDTIVNPKGTFYFNVEAWFSYELASFFGPSEYFGLPGLVLEVINERIILKAIDIKFGDLENKIQQPEEGVLIPKKEYVEYLNQTANQKLLELIKN